MPRPDRDERNPAAPAGRPAPAAPAAAPPSHGNILALQQSAGNAAVAQAAERARQALERDDGQRQ